MRPALVLALLFLAACSKEAEAPPGNEQAVIDKANADVMAAQAEAQAGAQAGAGEAAAVGSAAAGAAR